MLKKSGSFAPSLSVFLSVAKSNHVDSSGSYSIGKRSCYLSLFSDSEIIKLALQRKRPVK